jgi:nicotinate-nucleotide pyrophosphorylase (carboxylating)
VKAGQPVATISGPTRALLSAERVVLNFLSHLSGIATLTRKYVDAVAVVENPPAIADTRKTTPGFRTLDKYAVRCGGGVNHRMALYDGVMLKDNHLAALREQLGSNQTLAQLTAHVRSQLDPKITLWLEVDTLEQLREALSCSGGGGGADIILLDNFTPEQMRRAVAIRDQSKAATGKSKVLLEASGGVTLETLPEIAKTGIDRISIGALTHSAPILDLSMDMG